MRVWLHSSVRTPGLGAGTTLSLVAHALLIGAAIYGTALSARRLEESINQRTLTYLPPPDRIAGSRAAEEHLQYLDVGGGVPIADAAGSDLRLKSAGGPRREQKTGGNDGLELQSQAMSKAVDSPDSVYSVLEVEERAARTADSSAPMYPPDLMKAGTEGSVAVRFVVDTTGRADPGSIEIVRATHPDFAQSVRFAVPRMSFSPARVDGHKVRQAVEQTFDFKIVAPPPSATPVS